MTKVLKRIEGYIRSMDSLPTHSGRVFELNGKSIFGGIASMIIYLIVQYIGALKGF